ncbi:MAG: hypothetical protein KDJ86_11380 [Bauldia sp.]|uniref:hypothetical protein n=1 Tax=Bauldia sp. TaxID=2575872 RepID=UPI001D2728F4|nr:hypothetical protein [Bauldia sp.]MCB1496381.1 hypothetical protein [Bauldia sp.]
MTTCVLRGPRFARAPQDGEDCSPRRTMGGIIAAPPNTHPTCPHPTGTNIAILRRDLGREPGEPRRTHQYIAAMPRAAALAPVVAFACSIGSSLNLRDARFAGYEKTSR